MSVYAVGDVQGCYSALCRLLERIGYDETADALWLAGDLVNRGPESAQTLRLVKSLRGAHTVLGNHDLHLLAVARGFRPVKPTDTFNDVLAAPDAAELLDWLRGRPLLLRDDQRRCALVHAGIHPSWNLDRASVLAGEVERLLRDDVACPVLLKRMYGDTPGRWSDSMDEFDRGRWVINALTRMRYCTLAGEMDFLQVGPPGSQPDVLHPWFELLSDPGFRIFFGHWSMLGAGDHRIAVSLDSGCAHGGRLTAVNIDERPVRFIQVPCSRPRSRDTVLSSR